MLLWPGRPKHNDPKNKPHNRDHSHGRNQNDEAAIHAFGFFVFFKRLPIDVLVRGRRDCGIGLSRYLFEWGDNDGVLTLRARAFFAALPLGDADLMAASPARKLDNSRPFRHNHTASALRTFALLTGVLLGNADEPAAV